MGPYASIVEAWLNHDLEVPPKQRHTARRVYTRLFEEHGFTGSEVTVRLWVRQWKERLGYRSRDAVIPLDPECARESEVDWGTAQVWITGQLVTVKIFCMRTDIPANRLCAPIPWSGRRCSLMRIFGRLLSSGCFPCHRFR